MWGLLAAVGLAVYFVLSAAAAEPLPPIVMAWAGMCVGAAALGLLGLVGALPMKATAADVVFLGHRVSWLVPVLGLSLVAAVIAYVAGIGAARRLGAKLASFIGMTEVLFAILFARACERGEVGDVEAGGDDAAHQDLRRAGRAGRLPAAAAHHVLRALAGREVRAQGDRDRIGRGPGPALPPRSSASGPPECHSHTSSERTVCQHDSAPAGSRK